MSALRKFALCFYSIAFVCGSVGAVTLDWDTATWTNSATSGTPTTGVDINIAATTPGLFQPSLVNYPNVPTPAITTAFQGGLGAVQKSFELSIDLPSGGNTNTVTITLTFNSATFATGVQGVSFSIFDIDADTTASSMYTDKISNITATAVDGSTVAATISNLGSQVNNTNGVLTGLGTVSDTGATSGEGNATISFGLTPIRSITFTYGNSSAYADPTYQHIGISDVTFTPVPEINPSAAAAVSCLLVALLIRRHNARFRK